MSKVTYKHGSIGVNDRPGSMGAGTNLLAHYGLQNLVSEQRNRGHHNMSSASEALTSHVAVTNHGRGVGSENLANFIECFADYAKSRVLGTGNLQYNLDESGLQRFEELDGAQLCDELLDELADTINYVGMIAVKVLSIRKAL